MSKKSQKEVLEAAAGLGIAYADVADLPDDEVYRLLFPGRNDHVSVFEGFSKDVRGEQPASRAGQGIWQAKGVQ